jgi:hypothetical protein
MARRVTGRDGLDWRIKRLVVPTGFKPMSRTELLDTATPRRTSVEGMDRRVPDAFFAPTGAAGSRRSRLWTSLPSPSNAATARPSSRVP